MKLADHQTMRLMTDETSAVKQAGRRLKASVDDDRGVIEAALATTRFTAKEVSDRRWAEFVENGPIGFRSGTDPEAKFEAEFGVTDSHESRETINQTKQTVLAHSKEKHIYKPNHCKQVKRNSFELAKSHRLFTVEYKEKTRRMPRMSSNVQERVQFNEDEFLVNLPFQVEGAPILIDRTQINLKPHEATSSHMKPHKATSSHIKPHKATLSHTKPHKATLSHIKPHKDKVVVLTDVPPGSPLSIAQTQDVVNTVGPVPMTFGYGPNTFPHSAAHVLNTNHAPQTLKENI